jgi:hypothetical protein
MGVAWAEAGLRKAMMRTVATPKHQLPIILGPGWADPFLPLGGLLDGLNQCPAGLGLG